MQDTGREPGGGQDNNTELAVAKFVNFTTPRAHKNTRERVFLCATHIAVFNSWLQQNAELLPTQAIEQFNGISLKNVA